MGYKVVCRPVDGPSGFLGMGKVCPPWAQGTYYSSPSAALRAAKEWVRRHPGATAEVQTYKDSAVVQIVS